jgi:predicted NBD/HSP70 family sugar kinase
VKRRPRNGAATGAESNDFSHSSALVDHRPRAVPLQGAPPVIGVTRKNAPTSSPARLAEAGRRAASASSILRAVLEHGPVARSTVARLTGLSPASVTGHSAELARLGLIRDLPEQVQSNGVGRPHLPVDIDTARYVAGAIHIAVAFSTVALLDLRGRVLMSRRTPHEASSCPAEIVRRAGECLLELLRDSNSGGSGGSGATPIGVGVACGGWVDQDSGTVVEHPMLRWHDVPLRDLVRGCTGLPVRVDGHSRALLHGERLFGAARGVGSVLHLFIGNVADAAFAIDDTAHYGPRSQAGVIAHIPITDSAEQCPCGRTGCFQASVSEHTLARRAVECGITESPDFPLLLAAARAGDKAAVGLLVERARLVGRGAALLIDVFNPELVVFTEQAIQVMPDALAALRAEIAASARTQIDVTRSVVSTSFPGDALATAGGSVILDAFYRDPLALVPGPTGNPD